VKTQGIYRKVLRSIIRAKASFLGWRRIQSSTLPNGMPLLKFPYVFIIGFNRTATTALNQLFKDAGIPCIHNDHQRMVVKMLKNMSSGRKIFAGYDKYYLVFSDLILANKGVIVEGNRFYIQMSRDYPNSLFILNTRSMDSWIRSRMRFNSGSFLRKQMGFLGTDDLGKVERIWSIQKLNHEAEVREFFSTIPERFLELNIETDDVPARLSEFLNLSIDSTSWKVLNQS
jgi:hypothetical protein